MNYESLSDKQRAILRVIQEWLQKRGYPPTIRDIGTTVGISSTSVVNYNLNKLVEGGFITRSKDVSRGIRLNVAFEERPVKSSREPQTVRVAQLGQIVAGAPMPTFDNTLDYEDSTLTIPQSLIGSNDPSQVYALTVKGYSMIDAMIDDGDTVILKHQQTAHNGEMVAVWLTERGETTLKRFYDEGVHIRLQPANPMMDPIFVDKDKIQVQGKVLAVIRRVAQ